MDIKKIIEEINHLDSDSIAKIIAVIAHRCLPHGDNWKDYYYKYFPLWEKQGFHLLSNHYYSPVPEIYKLPETFWDKVPETPGIDYSENKQIELLETFRESFVSEYSQIPLAETADPFQYHLIGGKFEAIDGYILYCMVRYLKPKRIIEIGSGDSTLLMAAAAQKNNNDAIIRSIEPFPNEKLKKGFPGLTEVIAKKVQEVFPALFSELEPNDILFIDSSHVLKIDGDVKYEYAQILPKLKSGVIIHIHDIFLPKDYPKQFIYGLLFMFNEQYLVQTMLANNPNYEILWAGHYMLLKYPDLLKKAFAQFDKFGEVLNPSSSLWLRKK